MRRHIGEVEVVEERHQGKRRWLHGRSRLRLDGGRHWSAAVSFETLWVPVPVPVSLSLSVALSVALTRRLALPLL
jgi:hypothetical protein